jgi:hypothetical protein
LAFACCSACQSRQAETAPRVSIEVAPSQAMTEAGSPIDVDYRMNLLPGAAPLSATDWVFVHMLDDAGRLLWTDDHVPPAPPSAAGEPPASYRRTMFVPRLSYTGAVRIEAGLFSRKDGSRVPTATGHGSGEMPSFTMRPPSNAVFVSFGDGWYGAERDPGEAAREWRWSSRDARLSFRNPQRDATLWLELDQPVTATGAQAVEIRAGAELLSTIRVVPGTRRIERVSLIGSRLGTSPTLDLDVHVQPTFVPASAGNSQDTRELGVRVFNVYVGQP